MTTATLEPIAARTIARAPPTQRYPLTQGVNPWLVTASVMLPTFMEVLDTAIASVALPYIAGSLSASNSEATWVLTSYLVANAVILPASNWFARRFGRKNFSVVLRGRLHRGELLLRGGPLAGGHPAGAGSAGSRRRSAAAALAVDPAGKLSRAEALAGHGRLRPGNRRRPGARPHARRMAHRHLQLAIRLLHQHPGRHPGRLHDQPLRPRSALHQATPKWAPFDNIGFGLLDRLDRLPAGRPRQGPGRRLVRRDLGALGRGGAGARARGLDLALVGEPARTRRPARTQEPQFPHRLLPHRPAGHVHLHHNRHPAAVLPGDPRLHRIHGRPGRGAARHRFVHRVARYRVPGHPSGQSQAAVGGVYRLRRSARSTSVPSIWRSGRSRCWCRS